MMTNAQRAEFAFRSMLAHRQYTNSDREDALKDLLANLMHLAAEQGTDFDEALAVARIHYEAETEKEREAA